jgi:hypothetical protein
MADGWMESLPACVLEVKSGDRLSQDPRWGKAGEKQDRRKVTLK